jgi:hypothetical protein
MMARRKPLAGPPPKQLAFDFMCDHRRAAKPPRPTLMEWIEPPLIGTISRDGSHVFDYCQVCGHAVWLKPDPTNNRFVHSEPCDEESN